MKIALGTHQLRGYPQGKPGIPEPLHRANLFGWMQRKGFDGIEVADWWLDFPTVSRETLREIKQELDDHDLHVAGFNCLRRCVTHPEIAAQNIDALKKAIEAGETLRPDVISISLSLDPSISKTAADRVKGLPVSPGGGTDAREGEFEEAAGVLAELANDAQSLGIRIALELHHCSIADTSARVLKILELADHANLCANPDLVNVYWAYDVPEEPWYEALNNLAPVTGFWHVKNTRRIHIPELNRSFTTTASLDDGDIDYRWALARMAEEGFDGYISIEGAGPGDLLASIERGRSYLAELIGDLKDNRGIRVH